jgi:hypothetical protein
VFQRPRHGRLQAGDKCDRIATLSAGRFVKRHINVALALDRSQNCDDVPKADVDGSPKKMRNGSWTVQSLPSFAASGPVGLRLAATDARDVASHTRNEKNLSSGRLV